MRRQPLPGRPGAAHARGGVPRRGGAASDKIGESDDMKTVWKVLIGVAVVALLAVWWYYSTYNEIVRLHEGIDAAWAQVETVLQRRYDLIPNR